MATIPALLQPPKPPSNVPLGLQTLTKNQRAFLSALAWSEGTSRIPNSDDGYRALVGGGTFASYADHPRKLIWIARLNINSTAAGRYQLLERYFDAYKVSLHLSDFSPASQDAIALQQIKECNALGLIESGDFGAAIDRCARIWASLPGSTYKQGGNTLASVRAAYVAAGGSVA